jgi:hypothetical protein
MFSSASVSRTGRFKASRSISEGRRRRLLWNWFGKKYEFKQNVEFLRPEIDTGILNCEDPYLPS